MMSHCNPSRALLQGAVRSGWSDGGSFRREDERGLFGHLCGDAGFVTRKRDLEDAKASLEGLKAVEEREWAELAARFRERRLPDHLRTFALEPARVAGLGPDEVASLAAEGITTAVDIAPERLMAIPHIDLELVRRLLLFKVAAARDYAFDPVTAIPGKDRKALGETQARRRAALLAALQSGPLVLAEARRQALVWRDEVGREIEDAHRQLARLRAESPPA
jgi:DNA-binding helix-hairpin-helix protein with protein kinase domain